MYEACPYARRRRAVENRAGLQGRGDAPAPTAIRVLKKQDPAYRAMIPAFRSSTCSWPASRSTSRRMSGSASARSSGDRSLLADRDRLAASLAVPGVEKTKLKMGSPSFPVARLRRTPAARRHRQTRRRRRERGDHRAAASAGLHVHRMWGDDERFVQTYFKDFKNIYSDVRLGHPRQGRLLLHPRAHRRRDQRRRPSPATRETRSRTASERRWSARWSASLIRSRARCSLAFAVLKNLLSARLADEVMKTVDKVLGAIARPRAVLRVAATEDAPGEDLAPLDPGTRRGRDPGDLTTIEDPSALEQIRQALK